MRIMRKLYRLIFDSVVRMGYLDKIGFYNNMSDEKYIKLRFKRVFGYTIDFNNVLTFNEKIQWLKLYDRNPKYTMMVDKYLVKDYVGSIIGTEHIIPTLAVWDNADDINFSHLPNKFVLKCNHNSGIGMYICSDKNDLNEDDVRKKLKKGLKEDYYLRGREWPYKNIKPRIICEELIKTSDGMSPSDYKFHCFNGEPDNVMVCIQRETGHPKFFFFNEQWELLRYNISGKNAPENFTLPKPERMEEMFDIARKLSKDIPFVRVDLYCEQGKIYFGELTFFPQSGFDSNLLESTDMLFGKKITFNNRVIEKKL